ncbi:hypothetical protein WUBG_08067, partial [Wuchereria bancrofti]
KVQLTSRAGESQQEERRRNEEEEETKAVSGRIRPGRLTALASRKKPTVTPFFKCKEKFNLLYYLPFHASE